jgi:hypothetical protein
MLLKAEACARWQVRHMTLSEAAGPAVLVTAVRSVDWSVS